MKVNESKDIDMLKTWVNGKSITFKKAIDKVRKKDRNKNINFSQIMKMALNEETLNKNVSYQIRNNIAHIRLLILRRSLMCVGVISW